MDSKNRTIFVNINPRVQTSLLIDSFIELCNWSTQLTHSESYATDPYIYILVSDMSTLSIQSVVHITQVRPSHQHSTFKAMESKLGMNIKKRTYNKWITSVFFFHKKRIAIYNWLFDILRHVPIGHLLTRKINNKTPKNDKIIIKKLHLVINAIFMAWGQE